jgi:hypothetical protein
VTSEYEGAEETLALGASILKIVKDRSPFSPLSAREDGIARFAIFMTLETVRKAMEKAGG